MRRGAATKLDTKVFKEAARNATHALAARPDTAVAEAVDQALRALGVDMASLR